jgi:hypothetical protein
MTMRYSSHAVARLADLTLVPVGERGLVHQRGPWLEIGPDASDDHVVTIACRRIVSREERAGGECSVRELVEAHGYAYVSPTGPSALAPARTDMSEQYVEKIAPRTLAR